MTTRPSPINRRYASSLKAENRLNADRLLRIDTAVEVEEILAARGITHEQLARRCCVHTQTIGRALNDPESRTADWWAKVKEVAECIPQRT